MEQVPQPVARDEHGDQQIENDVPEPASGVARVVVHERGKKDANQSNDGADEQPKEVDSPLRASREDVDTEPNYETRPEAR